MWLNFVVIATVVVSLVYASICEWKLHLSVMHAPVGKFRYPYETHALTHHRIFKADGSYHLIRPEDKQKIRMAWWNGIAIILIGSIPYYLGTGTLWYFGWRAEAVTIIVTATAVFAAYYGTYEYLHWCMHLPKARRLECSRPFMRLNGHHVLHHRYWMKNLNVVLPLADWLFRTLLLRSPVRFAQAQGPSVPDVQPI